MVRRRDAWRNVVDLALVEEQADLARLREIRLCR
jgi:hypothetical protein